MNMKNSSEDKSIFITSSKYKSSIDLFNQINEKISLANETHLKLLDLKAEEDLELENLRKDFVFIEKSLFEIDTIIFN